MKRKATAQLTREGGYEPVPEAESSLVSDSSPLEIQKRVFYRARRPLRQPQFTDDEKAGFKLKSALLTDEEEKKLLLGENKPLVVDFLSVMEPAKPKPEAVTKSDEKPPPAPSERLSDAQLSATPKSTVTDTVQQKPALIATPSSVSTVKPKDSIPLFSTPLTSPAFKSAGFKSLIEELSKKKSDEVAQTFIQTKTEGIEAASPRVVLPNPVEAKSVYSSVLSQECKFASNGVDKGPGKLEILCQSTGEKKMHTVIFRNIIGSIMYRAYLPAKPKLIPASASLIELAENESNYAELEFLCLRKEEKIISEKCQVAVPLAVKERFVEKFEQCKA